MEYIAERSGRAPWSLPPAVAQSDTAICAAAHQVFREIHRPTVRASLDGLCVRTFVDKGENL